MLLRCLPAEYAGSSPVLLTFPVASHQWHTDSANNTTAHFKSEKNIFKNVFFVVEAKHLETSIRMVCTALVPLL